MEMFSWFLLPKVHLSRRLFLGGVKFLEASPCNIPPFLKPGKMGMFFDFEAGSLLEGIRIISVKKLCPKISNIGFH